MKALGLVVTSGFVWAREMEEVCLELSNACRDELPCSLLINEITPPQLVGHVWPSSMATICPLLGQSRLVHRRKITRVRLEDDRAVMFATWPTMMKHLEFGDWFNRPVEGVSWPPGLEHMSFGPRFNQPVARVTWPPGLKELIFGNNFDQPVSGVDLPAGLERLDFGGRFNHNIGAVNWPKGLRELRFGHGFNRPIAEVIWPPGIRKMEFHGEFQQRIEEIVWPPSLEHLGLQGNFNQPVHGLLWPKGLKTIIFGDGFKRSLTAVRWPPTLETIVLGCDFDRNLGGILWPVALKKLTVPLERLLGEDRSNIPASCTVESLFGSGGGGEGAFVDPHAGDEVEVDEAEDYGFSEDEYGDSGVDVFGYQDEPWDMGEAAWDAPDTWDELDLSQVTR